MKSLVSYIKESIKINKDFNNPDVYSKYFTVDRILHIIFGKHTNRKTLINSDYKELIEELEKYYTKVTELKEILVGYHWEEYECNSQRIDWTEFYKNHTLEDEDVTTIPDFTMDGIYKETNWEISNTYHNGRGRGEIQYTYGINSKNFYYKDEDRRLFIKF